MRQRQQVSLVVAEPHLESTEIAVVLEAKDIRVAGLREVVLHELAKRYVIAWDVAKNTHFQSLLVHARHSDS